MKNKKLKNITKYYIDVLLIIILILTSISLYKKINKEEIERQITYSSNDEGNYQVYYNNEIISSESFIRKYTDKIDINFDYFLNFTDIVNIKEETLVKATLLIYAPNSESVIWKKTEYIIKPQIITYEITNQYRNSNKVTIDYQNYLNTYNEFKNDTSIISNAKILVEFVSSSIAQPTNMDEIIVNDTITYEIPISDLTYSISKKETTNTKTIKKYKMKTNKKLYTYLLRLSYTCAFIILVLMFIRYYKTNRKDTYKLNKILKTYDSIIVNIEKMPDLTQKDIINVTSFDELLNAQMELRLPINYVQIKNEFKFIILTCSIAWIYTLRKEN